MSIGIQIRVGDEVFDHGAVKTLATSYYFQNFFGCVNDIEKNILTTKPDAKFLWYLISDSLPLKKEAKAKYGK